MGSRRAAKCVPTRGPPTRTPTRWRSLVTPESGEMLPLRSVCRGSGKGRRAERRCAKSRGTAGRADAAACRGRVGAQVPAVPLPPVPSVPSALAARARPDGGRRCRCRSRRCSCLPSHRRRASPRPLHLLHRSGSFRATPRRRPAGAPGGSATRRPRRPGPPAGTHDHPPRPRRRAGPRRGAPRRRAPSRRPRAAVPARGARAALCLETLPRLYRRVLVLRAGVGRQDVLTLAQTARRVDRRERAVRRIERGGVRRMRAADRDGRCGAAAPDGAGATGTVQAGDELAVAGDRCVGGLGRRPGLRRGRRLRLRLRRGSGGDSSSGDRGGVKGEQRSGGRRTSPSFPGSLVTPEGKGIPALFLDPGRAGRARLVRRAPDPPPPADPAHAVLLAAELLQVGVDHQPDQLVEVRPGFQPSWRSALP